MQLNYEETESVHVLRPTGRLDTHTTPDVKLWLESIVASKPAQLVINLNAVNFVDSTGLATLVQGMKRCREHEGDLLLCDLQRPVRMIFELPRLDKAFTIYPSESDAIAAFSVR
jgi:anti-sigma B factor antagonist